MILRRLRQRRVLLFDVAHRRGFGHGQSIHLAEQVANESETTRLRDEWGHKMLREQKYTPGQIDAGWSAAMIEDFNKWAAAKGSKRCSVHHHRECRQGHTHNRLCGYIHGVEGVLRSIEAQ